MKRVRELAGRARNRLLQTVTLWPGVVAVACLATAGALVAPALGFAVVGVLALVLDWRLSR